MKRYVKIACYAGALTIMLVLLTGCILVFSKVQRSTVEKNLRVLINMAQVMLSEDESKDLDRLARSIAAEDENLRVTLLDTQGLVLSDSVAAADEMVPHGDRPEIRQAMAGEVGTDVRKSATTGIQMLYAAQIVSDGLILRLSYPTATTLTYLQPLVPVLAFLCLILLAAVPLFTRYLGLRVTKLFIRINDLLLDRGDEKSLYLDTKDVEEEVQPILGNISYLIEKLKYDFEEVRKTQQLRTDFVANASHELKTPLTSIKGFAELLAGGMVSDQEKQKLYLQRIVSESDRLLNIINDILRLSKAESKQPEKLERVALQPLAKDVIQALEPLAKARNITLAMDGTGYVWAASREIWELIYNLVDNAIRYGKPTGHVAIHLAESFLSVEDDGIGMEEQYLTRIFERFYRIDKSHSRQTGGTGLGLSIVKHIAQNYGGSLQVKSRPGEGSTFSVQFPSDLGADSLYE